MLYPDSQPVYVYVKSVLLNKKEPKTLKFLVNLEVYLLFLHCTVLTSKVCAHHTDSTKNIKCMQFI